MKEEARLVQDAAGRRVAREREAALLRQLRHTRIPRFIASFQESKGSSTRL